MRQRRTYLGLVLAAIATVGLAQCGGKKTAASQISFEVIPDKPIVITADTLVNGTKLTNPWFRFSLKMTNSSDQPVTMVAVTAQITAPNSVTATSWAEDPGSQSSTLDSGTSSAISTTCNYTTYGTWNPGDSKPFGLPGAGACDVDNHPFYVGSLKKPDQGVSSYRYKVVLKPIGWFGTEDAPTDRLDTQITFYTQ